MCVKELDRPYAILLTQKSQRPSSMVHWHSQPTRLVGERVNDDWMQLANMAIESGSEEGRGII